MGWDFVNLFGITDGADNEDLQTRDNDPMDIQGHGTHVSGIIAAQLDNNIGISGISNCSIMALRAGYKVKNGGGNFTVVDVMDALKYAADNGANVINLSLGAPVSDILTHEAFAEAIQYVNARNVLMVAAAGNSNNDMDLVNFIPAAYEQVIAVGSVDEDFNKSGFSNYGASLDLTAPGNDTSQRGIISTYPDNNYAFLPGTSQSALKSQLLQGFCIL